ncbi:hypothetical protein EVAR_62947_1 [Eumeta japonica]|uniref:Uncharacterized protein n=1 Tax=Eumeta variegata TaxID=151549 RepID=A0A4C1SY65_EUMVA|nr:hypothetical protein EVAR_62947_1 [Eumeta japonica]
MEALHWSAILFKSRQHHKFGLVAVLRVLVFAPFEFQDVIEFVNYLIGHLGADSSLDREYDRIGQCGFAHIRVGITRDALLISLHAVGGGGGAVVGLDSGTGSMSPNVTVRFSSLSVLDKWDALSQSIKSPESSSSASRRSNIFVRATAARAAILSLSIAQILVEPITRRASSVAPCSHFCSNRQCSTDVQDFGFAYLPLEGSVASDAPAAFRASTRSDLVSACKSQTSSSILSCPGELPLKFSFVPWSHVRRRRARF